MDLSVLNNPYIEFVLYIAIGLIAGIINALAGGGSLLTLPLLIFSGFEPAVANGTNRIGVFFQSLFATLGYKSKKVNTFPFELHLSIPAVLGAIIGSQIAIDIPSDIFNKILVIVMVAVVTMIVLQSKSKRAEMEERIAGSHRWVGMTVFFFIGIYGGFIQAGIGYFIMFWLSMFHRMSLLRANAIKASTVTAYMLVSIFVFYFNDKIVWKYGIYLAIGGALGSWLASRYSVKKGEGVIKFFLVFMVIVMGVKLWFFK